MKIVAGAAQLGFACWLIRQLPRSRMSVVFAIAFGANGIAYVFFNLGMPGQRTAGSLAVEGRAVFNWIATTAMVVFASLLVGTARSKLAALGGSLIGVIILIADFVAVSHPSLLQFGGIAIYPATALVLGMLPVLFMQDAPALNIAWLAGALAINSVDHLGAELIRPSPTPETAILLQIAAMAIVLVLWIVAGIIIEGQFGSILLVIACMVLPFAAGIMVREVAGSYTGVQRSGLIGVGRLVATGLLAYAVMRRNLFSFSSKISALHAVTGG